MPLYKEKEAYVFNPYCRLLGGVKQALWLTKSSLIEGLPKSVTSIYEDPTYTFPNHEELVHNTISDSCLWSTTEEQRPKEEYCPKLLQGLLHLCLLQSCSYPGLSQRSFIENYRLAASWRRESDLYLVRGITGVVMSAKTALEPQASPSAIQVTEQQALDSLYPLSPAIDLQEVNVYEEQNHLATLLYKNPNIVHFCFQEDVKNLEKPVVVQSVATDGQLFHFMVLQLNTLDLESSDGIKNIIWMDGDQALYDTVASKAKIRRKVVVVPAGVSGLKPETFLKFWAMYLNGAV
uniref:Large ribosomal subunit protein mL37 n=1 Tax=Pyxicephalus adspersus TaxID=30357 RepID=A0AAV3A349_PYXAD|nr:TPA: hypothetical protein GDO54_016265 [Pyxicephalus adspersus]